MQIKGHLKLELESKDSVTVKLPDEVEITITDKILIINTPESSQEYGYRIVPTMYEGNKLEEFLLQ